LTLHVAINSFSHFLTDISLQGAAFISGPPELVDIFYDYIPDAQHANNGFYIFPCDTDLPDIVLHFGDVGYVLAHNFNRGPWQVGSPDCLGSIIAVQPANVWTIGTVFMSDYYTIFDVGNRRVGFAELA
jgi:hypothetical protein